MTNYHKISVMSPVCIHQYRYTTEQQKTKGNQHKIFVFVGQDKKITHMSNILKVCFMKNLICNNMKE